MSKSSVNTNYNRKNFNSNNCTNSKSGWANGPKPRVVLVTVTVTACTVVYQIRNGVIEISSINL